MRTVPVPRLPNASIPGAVGAVGIFGSAVATSRRRAAQTALYRLPPAAYLAAHTFFLAQGETLDVEALRAQLALAGYTHVTQVVSPGEFSVRGGLIDLLRAALAGPLRDDTRQEVVQMLLDCRANLARASFNRGATTSKRRRAPAGT